MKAFTHNRYGPPSVLHLQEIATPRPGASEILIRVHATTVSSGDHRARALDVPGFGPIGRLAFGIFGPRQPVLGTELAGVVEKIGASVTGFAVGDRVFADCGMKMGAHAQYKVIDQNGAVAHVPEGIDLADAAAICFGGTTALKFLCEKGRIKRGDKVLINGASGTVGLAAVQLASHFGAEVTAVCSGANANLARSVGASDVIDYTSQDFTRLGRKWDIIMDTAATAPWARSKHALTSRGRLLLVNSSLGDMLRAPFVTRRNGKKLMAGVALGNKEILETLAGLVAQGHFTPVIDWIYPFSEMRKAHAHVDTGHKRGSVVISLIHDEPAHLPHVIAN